MTSQAASGQTARILGVDPGLNVTGYGVVAVGPGGLTLVEAGVIRGTSKGSLAKRVAEIHAGVEEVLAMFQPQAMAVEQLYSHYSRPRTAILMGHARGVICLAAARAQVTIAHYAATRIKKLLTGNGRAPKGQVQAAIQREFQLDCLPAPADVADALAVAICHYYLSRPRLEITPTTADSGRTG